MRIVSLCPSLTELVFDLGRGNELVGVTKFCVHPAAGVAEIEKVGGTKNPKIERILALAPDLVLLNEEENRIEDAEALRAAMVPVHASFPRTTDETAAMVRSIGAAVGASEEADRIARAIESRAERVRAVAGRAPVRYAYLIWREPIMVAGGDTFIADLLSLAGGVNVFGDGYDDGSEGDGDEGADRYPAVSVSELAAAAPDAVLLSTEPFPFRPEHAEELASATGIPRERFRIVDGELLSWHGSRTPRGIDYAESVLEAIRSDG